MTQANQFSCVGKADTCKPREQASKTAIKEEGKKKKKERKSWALFSTFSEAPMEPNGNCRVPAHERRKEGISSVLFNTFSTGLKIRMRIGRMASAGLAGSPWEFYL